MLNSEYTLQETMLYADARKWTDQQLLQDIDLRMAHSRLSVNIF